MEFTTEREAVGCVAVKAAGGMRFHDLRHAYAAWLVTDGVPRTRRACDLLRSIALK
ncbi:hypothetical protein AB0F68_03095 [Micromonospora sp. NPDC023966]|uniref:hypothetical protein n=1 Tax=Micromonospora sp. NPDC023966 TaxID=3154699 RepID=UPI0033D0D37E